MSTHNICFYGETTKIIPKLSSNTSLHVTLLLFLVVVLVAQTVGPLVVEST